MGFCKRCGDIVVGPRCKCGGTPVAPVVKWNQFEGERGDKWSRTYVTKEKSSTLPANDASNTTQVESSSTSNPVKRFPQPNSRIANAHTDLDHRVSAHIKSATTSRPPSPLKYSALSQLDHSSNAAAGILPNPNGSELSKVYGSVLQPKETLATYSCAICATPFSPDATIYPDPSTLSVSDSHTEAGTRFLCRSCFTTNGGSKGDCPVCHRPVLILKTEGGFVETGGRFWHKGCFCCEGCFKNIGDNPMVDLLGRPSCVDCFDNCLKRPARDTPRRSGIHDDGDRKSNIGGSKGTIRSSREGSPALDELETRLGIFRSRENTPAIEERSGRLSMGTRSPPSKNISFPSVRSPPHMDVSPIAERMITRARANSSLSNSPSSLSHVGDGGFSVRPLNIIKSPESRTPGSNDGSPVPNRRSYSKPNSPDPNNSAREGSPMQPLLYDRFNSPERGSASSKRMSAGSPGYGSPVSAKHPTEDAIEEMKQRFLRQASPGSISGIKSPPSSTTTTPRRRSSSRPRMSDSSFGIDSPGSGSTTSRRDKLSHSKTHITQQVSPSPAVRPSPSNSSLRSCLSRQKTGESEYLQRDRTGTTDVPLRRDRTGDAGQGLRRDRTGDSEFTLHRDKTGDSIYTLRRDKTGENEPPLRRDRTGETDYVLRRDITGGTEYVLRRDKTGEHHTQLRRDQTGDNETPLIRHGTGHTEYIIQDRTGETTFNVRRQRTGEAESTLRKDRTGDSHYGLHRVRTGGNAHILPTNPAGDAQIALLSPVAGDLIDLSTFDGSSMSTLPHSQTTGSMSRIPLPTRDSAADVMSRSWNLRSTPSHTESLGRLYDRSSPSTPDLGGDFSDTTTQSSAPSTPPLVSPPSHRRSDAEPKRALTVHYDESADTKQSAYKFRDSTQSAKSRGISGALSSPQNISPNARCAKCKEALFSMKHGGKFVTVPEEPSNTGLPPKTYHAVCFRCRICDGPFEERAGGRAVFVRGEEGACHVECVPHEKVNTRHSSSSITKPSSYTSAGPSFASNVSTKPTQHSASRYERPQPTAPPPDITTSIPQPRFGSSSSCPGCHRAVSIMERGVVPGPQGSRWHSSCLVCGGKEATRRRKEEGKPGCGKQLDSAAKSDRDGGIWCRECLLLLPTTKRDSLRSPLVPSLTGGRGPFGSVAPQYTGVTTLARHFTGVGGSDPALMRQLTGGGLSPTRQLASSPTKMHDGPRPGTKRFPRPRSVVGTRSTDGEGRVAIEDGGNMADGWEVDWDD